MKQLFQKLLIAGLLVIAPICAAQAQDPRIKTGSLDHLTTKASQTVDVNIDERLIRMASRLLSEKNADEKEVKQLIAGIKGIYVRSFQFENDGQYSPADVESIRSQLRGPSWTKMVNVTSKKDGSLEVYILLQGDQIGGLAVISSDDREFTVVNIVGPVDIDKLSKLEGQLGVPELGIESTKPKAKNNQ